MCAHLIAFLILSTILTGCSLFKPIRSETKPINATDLATKHNIHQLLKKNAYPPYIAGLHDSLLNQLISVAFVDAPNIRIARIRVQRAQHLAKLADSSLWPSVSLAGSLEQAYFPIHGTLPPQFSGLKHINKASIADVGLGFNYEFDFWGKNRALLASKLDEIFAQQMDLAQAQLILSSSIATTYIDVQNEMLQEHLARKNAHLLHELAQIILDRAKQGIESNIPASTALANAQTAKLSIADHKQAQMHSRHRLALLMGKNPLTTQIAISPFAYNKKQVTLPAVVPANLLAQRPDIAAARALAESAAHQVHVARTAFYPNVNLKGLLSIQSFYFNKLFNVWLQNDNVSAAFDLPIFDAGARRANLRISEAQYELAVNQYNETILNALKEASDPLSSLSTLKTQIDAQERVVKQTQSNNTLIQAQFAHGIIDYTLVIEIKQLLIQQEAVLRRLQAHQIQAYIALLTALGEL